MAAKRPASVALPTVSFRVVITMSYVPERLIALENLHNINHAARATQRSDKGLHARGAGQQPRAVNVRTVDREPKKPWSGPVRERVRPRAHVRVPRTDLRPERDC